MLKMPILFLSILLMGFGFNTYGQIGAIIRPINRHIENFPEKNKTTFSTAKLAHAITKDATTEKEKVFAIYKWITSNISYDNELRLSSKLQKEFYTSEENVIKKALER